MAKKLTKKKKAEILNSQAFLTITSREIAEMTGKRHADVIRDIEVLQEQTDFQESSQNATLRSVNSLQQKDMFYKHYYQVGNKGKKYTMYVIGETFGMLLMTGYSAKYRLSIIRELQERRQAALTWHQDRKSLRLNHPELTDELSKLKFHEDGTPRRDHKGKRLVMRWSTELDMMNKIVLGMQAKKFKEIHGVEDVRDAMTNDELYLLDQIQNYNVILTRMGRGYYERKDLLERYMETLH